MKSAFSLVLAALLLPGPTPARAAATTESLSRISWMIGCRAGIEAAPGTIERWTSDGAEMHGISESGAVPDRRVLERMTIAVTKDGTLEFTASPRGQDTATFTMTGLTDDEIVFENPDHDFPQRLIYRLISESELLGRIEGDIDGQERSVDFPMRRVPCTAH
jgi:hypothetical protein